MPQLVDLSHPIEDGQLTFPGDPGVSVQTYETIDSVGFNLAKISFSTHQGTHLDAPFHFYDDGKTIDRMPLERFYGPAVLIDLAPGTQLAPKTPITVEMLRPHEAKFRPGARVIYRTGWDRAYNTPEYFADFPSLTIEAAEWIAGRRIGLLGMDTGTPGSDWKECHLALLHRDVEIVVVEGLANLDRLPERFVLIALPLNFKGRDGSPIRAVAVIDD